MITNHTELLQALIDKHGLKSYLEIGVRSTEQNFDKIVCRYKVGVDPEFIRQDISVATSDEFFEWNIDTFDLIFIDGLHHADQVKRDFKNSLRCLSDNGFIVIHDVLPENEEGTIVPRQTKVWWGTVFSFAMNINRYSGIDWVTFNIDNGCMVIRKTDTIRPQFDHHDYTWEQYQEIGSRLMNVTDEVKI